MPPSTDTPSPTPTPALRRQAHQARIQRVVDYIDAHLAEPLDLRALAAVAHFSDWHFHRIFQAATGETLAACVRRRRLEVAAQRLLGQPDQPVLHVAVEVGFASAEVFDRAFKARFGCTPTAWRQGAWHPWTERQHAQLRKIHQANSKTHQAGTLALLQYPHTWPARPLSAHGTPPPMHIEIQHLPAMRLAYMRHTGPYGSPAIVELWQRFAAWATAQGLMEPRPRMYGISHDDPGITPPERCRYDACVAVDARFQPRGDVGVQAFAGGRHACARFTGTGDDIHGAWMRLYGEWLPASGWEAGDGPGLELYETDFAIDPQTGAFPCWLCIPIQGDNAASPPGVPHGLP